MTAACRLLALAMLVVAGAAPAATDLTDVDAAMRRVGDGRTLAYRAVLADYERAVRERPRDGALAAARCEFVGRYVDLADAGDPAQNDLARCQQALRDRYGNVPEARVALYVQGADDAGDDEIAHGDALLAQSQAWPPALRCRLVDAVATRLEDYPASSRPGELAVESVRLCHDTRRVAEAFLHLVRQGLAQPAADLFDKTPLEPTGWIAERRVRAALAHPDRTLARRELERARAAGAEVTAITQARALLNAGDAKGAAGALGNADATAITRADPTGDLRFRIAQATGDAVAATALVAASGFDSRLAWMTQFERYRATVAMRPVFALAGPLLPYTGAVLAALALLVLLPGVVLVPAHYRGLVRRARGLASTPLFESVGLTRTWVALLVALGVPVVIGGIVSPSTVTLGLPFWSSMLQLALLARWALQLGRDGWLGTLGFGRTSRDVLKCWGALMVVMLLQAMVLAAVGGDTQTAQTRAVDEVLGDGLRSFGVFGTLAVIALLAPLVEELVFRGFVLGGLSRHLSFGAANLLQAGLFAAFHGDPPRFVFYLAMGLFAGWLVRRSGGLAPAFALHAINNGLFTLLFFVFG